MASPYPNGLGTVVSSAAKVGWDHRSKPADRLVATNKYLMTSTVGFDSRSSVKPFVKALVRNLEFIHFGSRDSHASTPSGSGEPASHLVSQAHPSGVLARLCPVVTLERSLLGPPRVDMAAPDREPERARLLGKGADPVSARPAPLTPAAAQSPRALLQA